MNNLIFLCMFFGIFSKLYSTPQIPDNLIWNNEEYSILEMNYPLESLFTSDEQLIDRSNHPIFRFTGIGVNTTANYRGYVATWKFIRDKLYLIKLVNASYEEMPLRALFGRRFKRGRILADWVNSTIKIAKGKILYKFHASGSDHVYANEYGFKIEAGRIVETFIHDNSKTYFPFVFKYTPEYYQLPIILSNPIHTSQNMFSQNVNWDSLQVHNPEALKKPINELKVQVLPTVDDEGNVLSLEVVNEVPLFVKEITLNALKPLRKWIVIYQNGRVLQNKWKFTIVFCKCHFYEREY